MTVREHKSQHDHVESLPLVSKSATVSEAEAMDEDRSGEIRQQLLELGRKHGFAEVTPARGSLDWDRIFGERGVRWFHLGGIFTALSDSCIEVAREAMKAAHDNGTIVSYDLNFRSKLWTSEKAIDVTTDLVQYMDVVIGNEEDFQKVLGFDVEGVDESYQELQTENYKKMVNRVVDTYPNIKAVATTLREVISADENNWSALLYHEGDFYHSVKFDRLQIEDRVGGGDGFCSGLVYALLNDYEPQDAFDFVAAHGVLVQIIRGDNSKADLEEVKEAAAGGSARIKR
jgi:2-dehydro-3-deoxygluconokinase